MCGITGVTLKILEEQEATNGTMVGDEKNVVLVRRGKCKKHRLKKNCRTGGTIEGTRVMWKRGVWWQW